MIWTKIKSDLIEVLSNDYNKYAEKELLQIKKIIFKSKLILVMAFDFYAVCLNSYN